MNFLDTLNTICKYIVLAAIALTILVLTQAEFHEAEMRSFEQHLMNISEEINERYQAKELLQASF